MRKFFKKIATKLSPFFTKLKEACGRVASAIGLKLRDVSIALSGAAPTMGWLGGTVAAMFLGMPMTAMTMATFTALAFYGTVMYRDEVEANRLYNYLLIADATGQIIGVGRAASRVRSERRARRSRRIVLSTRGF